MISKDKLNKLLEEVQNLSFEAGEILLRFQKRRNELIVLDKGLEGVASEADSASEDFIIKNLNRIFPEAQIFSEEGYGQVDLNIIKNSSYYWVIDPLDGTNNFLNGIPIFATSIALLYKGEPILGVVYNPVSGECFYSSLNKGSFFVDYRVNPLKKYTLLSDNKNKKTLDCVFSPAPNYEKKNKFESQIDSFKKNIIGARAVRRLGCAAIEISYVAKGNFDGYWEKGLKVWDTAAAWLICKEAGITVTDFFGQEFDIFSSSILVANKNVHSSILGRISQS